MGAEGSSGKYCTADTRRSGDMDANGEVARAMDIRSLMLRRGIVTGRKQGHWTRMW